MGVARAATSADTRAGFESERHHHRGDQQRKRYCVIPGHFFLQEGDGEDNEHRHGDHFLNALELKARKCAAPAAIGGHRGTVLQQGDQPGDEDGLPQRPGMTVFEVSVPRKGS